ncbi:MAG TPA: hypothetical protein VGA37_14265 [Gemmatimonadales bacterium]
MRSGLSGNPSDVASRFFRTMGKQLYSLGSETQMREARIDTVGDLAHVRLRQFYRGVPIHGGEVRVHLQWTGRGYAVYSTNGRVFADLPEDAVPGYLNRSEAAELVAAAWPGVDVVSISESLDSLSFYPFEERLRLAVAGVADSAGARLRFWADATTGSPIVTWRAMRNSAVRLLQGQADINVERGSRREGPFFGNTSPWSESDAAAGFVWGSGTDVFGVFHNSDFRVYYTGSTYRLRSNQVAPWVSEIRVWDLAGADLPSTNCASAPWVHNSTTQWGNSQSRREEVTGMLHAVSAGMYLHDVLGRSSYDGSGSIINVCVDGTDPFGWQGGFNAAWIDNNRFLFTRAFSGFGAAVGPKNIVTHEVMHAVSHSNDLDVATDGDFDSAALNEALSDYFGARHHGDPCIGAGAVPCIRDLTGVVQFNQRYQLLLAGRYHDFGVLMAGALWEVAALSPPIGTDVDLATFDAMRFYMLWQETMLHTREAIVAAAQDRAHNNLSSTNPVPLIEQELYERGVGFPPVQVSLFNSLVHECGYRLSVVVGSTRRRYSITFQTGSGQNQDQSVASVQDEEELEILFVGGSTDFDYGPLDLGGHQQGDGHAHAFRVRFTDNSGGIGGIFHDYYRGVVELDECVSGPELNRTVIVSSQSNRVAPSELTVRQSVSGDVAGGLSLSGYASGGVQGGSIREQVRRHGIRALEIGIPEALAAAQAHISIHNMRGKLIREMTEAVTGGRWFSIEWDGRDGGGSDAAPGVYLVVVRVGDHIRRTRFILPSR